MDSEDKTLQEFAERLRSLRSSRGLSVVRLAQLAGISQGYISQIEAGHRKTPGIGTVKALAAALRVSVDDLVGFDLAAVEAAAAASTDPRTEERLSKLERALLRTAKDVREGFGEIRDRLDTLAAPVRQPASHRSPRQDRGKDT